MGRSRASTVAALRSVEPVESVWVVASMRTASARSAKEGSAKPPAAATVSTTGQRAIWTVAGTA